MELERSILIEGAGAVGGVFGAALHAAGWRVRCRVRDGTADAYREHGLRVIGADGAVQLPAECFAPPAAADAFALVLLAVKMPDLVAALESAAADDDDRRWIITVQNGLDAPVLAAARFGRSRVLAGAAVVNAVRETQPGGARAVRMQSSVRRLALAPLADVQLPRAVQVAAALGAAGIEASASGAAPRLLWHKFVGLEPLATACALSQRTLGELRDDPASLGLLRGLFAETAGLARALRLIEEPQLASRWQAYVAGPGAMLPSLAIDVGRGLPVPATELQWLTGAVVAQAQRRNVPAPLHEAALRALTCRPARPVHSVDELLALDLQPTAHDPQPRRPARSVKVTPLSAQTPLPTDAGVPPAPPPPQLTVRLKRDSDVQAVDALRIASYARATWFTLTDANRIRCAQDAPAARVTVVCDGESLIATICQVPVANRAQAEALLEMNAPVRDEDFPALVISRAATAEGYAGLRLNHLLRWYTLKAAAASDMHAILGGHARGTPNLRVMAELGYRFREVSLSSMSQVEVNTEHVMSYLPSEAFGTALARLAPLIEPALAASRWEGAELSFAPATATVR